MAAVQDANKSGNNVMFIGVDVDQAISAPEYEDIMLTSIMKRIDNGVKGAIKAALDGTFKGGVLVNTLSNEGVGLAPFHKFEDKVPADLKTEIDGVRAKIISGEIKIADWFSPQS